MKRKRRKGLGRTIQWILVSVLLASTAWMMNGFHFNHSHALDATASTYQFPKLISVHSTSEPNIAKEKKAVSPSLSHRIVEYHISVRYDANNKALIGTQSLTWKNPGQKPVQTLYFHLYPNAFESKETTFMKESGGKLRNDNMKVGSFGNMRIHSIKTTDGYDLLPTMRYLQPDDHNQQDHTLMKISLPEPIFPHEKTTINMTFTVRLPFAFARMGYVKDFVMAGQWFPKIAVYEPAGTRGRTQEGWNLHQYHGNSEFYSDFGVYDVRIGVPKQYIVAATGFPIKAPVYDGKFKWYHFYADDVHDFAWAASPHFIYAEQSLSGENLPGVKIKLYLDPQQKGLKDRYFLAAKNALTDYTKWYGTYPYSTLSIVIPPDGGNGAGGMEYPTLVTGWAAKDSHPDLALERVIVHEIGHQFFYGMVASNEFEEAWLDEGFTTYSESRVMQTNYGVKDNLPLEAAYITDPAALKKYAWNYKGHSEYADNVYTRAKLVLLAIRNQIGDNTMNLVLKTYFQRWQFRHPDTKDFQQVLEQVTHKSWKSFFDQFVYGSLMTDYAVEGIQVKPTKEEDHKTYLSAVTIQKRGGVYRPVTIHFHFSDGRTLTKNWNGQEQQIRYQLTHTAPIDWVDIDPNHSMILESKHINNFMKTNVDSTWRARWNLGTAKIVESILSWITW